MAEKSFRQLKTKSNFASFCPRLKSRTGPEVDSAGSTLDKRDDDFSILERRDFGKVRSASNLVIDGNPVVRASVLDSKVRGTVAAVIREVLPGMEVFSVQRSFQNPSAGARRVGKLDHNVGDMKDLKKKLNFCISQKSQKDISHPQKMNYASLD